MKIILNTISIYLLLFFIPYQSFAKLENKIIVKIEKGTPGDFLGCYANIKKIKNELNFIPKVKLKEGIKKFNDWLSKETRQKI